jgi:hypothetical protein
VQNSFGAIRLLLSKVSSAHRFRPLISDSALFIVVRFVKNVVSDTNAVTSEFEQSFAKLRADFLAGIDVATVIAVLDTQNTVLEVHRIVASTREVGLETKDAVLEVQQTLSKIGIYPI